MNKISKYFIVFFLCVLSFSITKVVVADTLEVGNNTIKLDGSVTTTVSNENTLFIGGNFTKVTINDNETVTRQNIVEINTEDQSVTSWNPQFDGPIHDIAIYNDKLFIAGQFSTIDAIQKAYIVTYNVNTKEQTDPVINIDKPVYALFVHKDTLYISGAFTNINDQDKLHIASFNLQENVLTTWNPQVNDTVYDMYVENNRIYIGGAFTKINDQDRNSIAVFNTENGNLEDWSPSINMTVTHIESDSQRIIVTGFTKLNEEVLAKRVILDPATGSKLSEENVTIEQAPVITLFQQEPKESTSESLMVDESKLGFKIPTLSDLLTFVIRGFFVIAGLAALFFLLLGALAWVTSGGDADAITAAQQKIQAAVVGLLMMVVVLAIVWTLEQVIFNRRICLGLSCPVTIPSLLQPSTK